MGSGNSRMGIRPSRVRANRNNCANLFSSLVCGGSSSQNICQREDYPDETPLNPAKHHDPVVNEIIYSAEESSVVSEEGTRCTPFNNETGPFSQSSLTASERIFTRDDLRSLESSQGEYLSESRELVPPYQVSQDYSHDESCRNRNRTEASTSFKEQSSSNPVSVNVSSNNNVVNGNENSENKVVPQICPEIVHPNGLSSQVVGGSYDDAVPNENHMGEVAAFLNPDSDIVPHSFDVSVGLHSLENETVHEVSPSGLGYMVSSEDLEGADGSVLQVDVLSISSNIFSSGNGDASSREATRNSRRLFWDAFAGRSSRRFADSSTIVFSTDNVNDTVSRDRWLLDFSSDLYDDGMGSDSRYLGSRIHNFHERRQRSRSEVWERLRSALDDGGHRMTSCPTGLHPDGTCSCESFLTTEESSTRASISRIVMVAEALFEVLDEIHRQPVPLSLSMMSLPAPESLVDSFPLKSHKKADKAVGGDDTDQCYICLADYDEGEEIRVLPCHHEYHMSCVDKWLKEIHGVCPLCRGDVRQGHREIPNVVNPESVLS
ncbi:hypothetical protein K2173_017854 [Erythroxylum novogranatense]|uniref:RING-type domain-containing protein n=1 Tax=Erythroxylum novogranatense TaxID=1862640 RepID=A0AAV8SMK0_9ROSI|nr:hypothetical protein K2173_017854 [Erythroxylum novogranatense]